MEFCNEIHADIKFVDIEGCYINMGNYLVCVHVPYSIPMLNLDTLVVLVSVYLIFKW